MKSPGREPGAPPRLRALLAEISPASPPAGTGERHPDPGALMRYASREASAHERGAIAVHLCLCESCSLEAARLVRAESAFALEI